MNNCRLQTKCFNFDKQSDVDCQQINKFAVSYSPLKMRTDHVEGYIKAYNACRELPKMQVLHSSCGHQRFLGIIQNIRQCVLHHHKPYKILISSKF